VVPCLNASTVAQPGWLAETVVRYGDIVSPVGEDDWEAAR